MRTRSSWSRAPPRRLPRSQLPRGDDRTLAILEAYKRERDPLSKLTIVTAEDEGYPDGFWPGEKHEQCAAFASRASGDYLWQVDADEFHLAKDIEAVRAMLASNPSIT
jgi:hypothetical protein